MRFKIFALIILILIIGFIWSYYQDYQKWSKKYTPTTGKTCTVFLIDGLDNEIFKEELKIGKLPVIANLIQKSLYVEEGISSFPTMTGYGFYPFITGNNATESGILGLRWFDRSRTEGNLRNYVGLTNIHMNADVSDTIMNFFELAGDTYTASINTYMNKGVKHSEMTGWSHTTAKYEGKSIFYWLRAIPLIGEKIAPDHLNHETNVIEIAKKQALKNPKFQWITFPSPDAYNHVFGTDETYRYLLHHIDSLIGTYIQYTNQLGHAQTRSIAIVSDHGISDVDSNFNFLKWAKDSMGLEIERGKSVHIFSSALDEPLSNLKNKDGFFVINGNLAAYLYMANPNIKEDTLRWKSPISSDILTNYTIGNRLVNIPLQIAKNPEIELVLYKQDKHNIMVLHGDEKAKIHFENQKLSYSTIKGNPLSYPVEIIGKYLSYDEWLQNTVNTQYPYAVPRIFDLFTANGIGDIVITSSKGVDLANDYEIFVGDYKGGHGALRKEVISVPYVYYRPEFSKSFKKTLTNEDLGKMIKNYIFE